MKRIAYLLLVAIFALPSCTDDDSNVVDINDEANLTFRLEQILEQSNLPGFTVGIIKNGEPVYQKSFGFQDLEKNVEYTNQTIQPIGSISKTFIGVAVVKAIELGYFNLGTPINSILAEPLVNPKNPSAEIQVKHLVNHTSGLVSPISTYAPSYYILMGENINSDGASYLQDFGVTQRNPKSLAEFVEAYYYEGGEYYSQENFTANNPGDFEEYTNTGSSLMALLIEKASGVSYQSFLKTHIFDPLGMNSTSFEYDLPNSEYATLYIDKQTPLPLYNLESFPDGALKASNDDMMKYVLNMMAGQRGESNLLFEKESYNLLFTPTTSNYSIFWDVLGTNAFGHTGSDPGLGSALSFSGNSNIGAFIITNFDTTDEENEAHFDEISGQIGDNIEQFLSN